MSDKSFLGAGLKFPPQINKATGRFVISSKEQSVKESVYIILMTQKLERYFEPNFGSRLMSYTFMDTGITSINIMIRDLKDTILSQEPRISGVDIEIDQKSKDGCLIVNIEYTLAEDNTIDNLVFPFYLNAVKEEETDGE